MKYIFYIFCMVGFIAGVAFYIYPKQTAPSNVVESDLNPGIKSIEEKPEDSETRQVQVSKASTSTTPLANQKRCGCCTDALEKIRQRRKELEMWAREMVDVHGYEEGMKRVTAKSPTLANRVQRILEKEKAATTPVPSALIP